MLNTEFMLEIFLNSVIGINSRRNASEFTEFIPVGFYILLLHSVASLD